MGIAGSRIVPCSVILGIALIAACSGDEGESKPTTSEDSGADAGTDSSSIDAAPNDGSTLADAEEEADAKPLPTYVHYDINHVLSTGQSDCVANGATPVLSATQPLGNLSFDKGVMTSTGCADGDGCTGYEKPTKLIPLVEGDQFFGYSVETMSFGFANQASVFAEAYFPTVGLPAVKHDILVSIHGRSGNTYWCLRKNPCTFLDGRGYVRPFDEALMQVADAMKIAEDQKKTYVVRAVTTIHGGSDHYTREDQLPDLDRNDGKGKVGNYAEALQEWQRDYELEIQKITKQKAPIPLFLSQFGSFTDIAVSRIPVRQMEAHVKAPGKVIVVTPNYPFVHADDCNHYSNHSQRRLGAYFAKAYQRTVVEGVPWEPLRPTSVTRNANVITVKFLVPVPPITKDETLVTNPGNLGFTYEDSTGSATITKVDIVPPDSVAITLSGSPTGVDKKLRYALNAVPGQACPGPTQGARGNIRDSDTTVGYHTDASGQPYKLYNWAVHFEADVP